MRGSLAGEEAKGKAGHRLCGMKDFGQYSEVLYPINP